MSTATRAPEPHLGRLPPYNSHPSPRTARLNGRRLVLAAVAVYLLTGVYLVPTDQQAVVTRFRRVVDSRVLPGIHYSMPWPIERIHKLKVRETRRAVVGGEAADQTLGRMQPFETQFLTGDQNIIQVSTVAQYTIVSPAEFLFRSHDVEVVVRDAVETQMAIEIGRRAVDALLTTEKAAVQEAVRISAQALVDGYGVGVQLQSVNIDALSPPAEVAEAFRDVASARADAARIVNEAHGYANDLVPRARGTAQELIETSEAYRNSRVNEADGEATRFSKLLQGYREAPGVTSQRLYFEAMEQILPRIRKLIVEKDVDLSLVGNPQ